MNFYKSSAMIMVVILIICLTVVGVMISQSKDEVKYPPTLSECPDYYEKQDSGACKDVKELNNGFSGCALVDFNNKKYLQIKIMLVLTTQCYMRRKSGQWIVV